MSRQCDRGVEGSGFVYAPGRVMTNAHVVAGVDEPFIDVNGRRTRANVVLFNPRLDVAVLATGDLGLDRWTSTPAARPATRRPSWAIPENGPFDARAARIRGELTLRSPDIYDRGEHVRKTYSVRGLVRSGNSGGPLVSRDGGVLGVIFAASVTDSSTGYALTAAQVAARGRHEGRVGDRARSHTGGCA